MNAVESKNKLVNSLNEEQLVAFLEELIATPGVDGPMIQALAMERFAIRIGHNSANNFRKEVFGRYIERMRKRKELSQVIAAHRDNDSGKTLADAASEELQQQVFEFLADNNALDLSDKDDMKRAESLSRIIKSARSEDRAMLDQLQSRVRELEAEKKQTAAGVLSAAKDAGASPLLIQTVREALNFRPPADTTKP